MIVCRNAGTPRPVPIRTNADARLGADWPGLTEIVAEAPTETQILPHVDASLHLADYPGNL